MKTIPAPIGNTSLAIVLVLLERGRDYGGGTTAGYPPKGVYGFWDEMEDLIRLVDGRICRGFCAFRGFWNGENVVRSWWKVW